MEKLILTANTSWSMIKFRYGLMKELSRNYDLYIVAPKDDLTCEIEKLDCTYIDINIDNKGSNPLRDIKLTDDLYKLYKKINPDLVIHYTIKPNVYGSIAAKLANIKSFSVIPGLGYTFINDNLVARIAKILYKIALKFPKKVFFINHDDKNEFISRGLVDKNKVDILPGEGVDTNSFKPFKKKKEDDKFRFLLIARMLYDKGVGEYVEASKILSNKYPEVEFGLLGYLDVDNPKAISNVQMDEWTKQDNVKFYGSTNDVKGFIVESDCVVLPSYREGISMTLLESSAMEKPIIATNVVGCRDVVDDGINGYLCEVKNAKDLATKMEKMMDLSEEQRMQMGKKGREKVLEEFDERIVINKYLQNINQALSI